MLVTRNREDWTEGSTFLDADENDSYPGACINIDDWVSRIVCYGKTIEEADELRAFVMEAVRENYGV